MTLLWSLAIGATAGWLAGQIRKGKGYGIIYNILLGISGGVVGGFAFGLLGFQATNTIGALVSALVGALLLLYIIDRFRD